MIPLDDAIAVVLERVVPLPSEPVALGDALGCVVAESVVATVAVPPFANSAVDGFAVRAAEVTGASADRPVGLRVVATVAAGEAPERAVQPGTAVRIMTGAPIPEGADAVVMVEDTAVRSRAGEEWVEVRRCVDAAVNVRDAGSDVVVGTELVGAGSPLGPALLGLLATAGVSSVRVTRRPRVGVLSTGDELVEPGRPLGAGQIYDSNRRVLLSRLVADGFVPVDLGVVGDDPDVVEATIAGAGTHCDALLTSGGVSMGDFDPVKVALGRIGDMAWMQIAIKPAKPFAFGTVGALPVFGLPGNPVSSLVSFELLARPGLRCMAGHGELHHPRVPGVAAEPFARRDDAKTHFVRAEVRWGSDGRLHARSAGGQGSHQLSALAAANALVVLPPGSGAEAGADVTLVLLGPPRPGDIS